MEPASNRLTAFRDRPQATEVKQTLSGSKDPRSKSRHITRQRQANATKRQRHSTGRTARFGARPLNVFVSVWFRCGV
jgi:hypothetical protein